MVSTDRNVPESGAASFRDPAGRLYATDKRIIRFVTDLAASRELTEFLALQRTTDAVQAGQIVNSWPMTAEAATAVIEDGRARSILSDEAPQLVIEHERIPFPSYPYEWAPEMLHAAAKLTLDLAVSHLDEGYGLKDATPYNVLFRGTTPVFVDLLSFEKRDDRDATWLPYGQFIRTFLMPLLVNKRQGTTIDQIFLSKRDGLEPEEVYKTTGPLARFGSPTFGLVSLPTWLARGKDAESEAKIYEKKRLDNADKAKFILQHLLSGLQKTLAKLKPSDRRPSHWRGYMAEGGNNYSATQLDEKQVFVKQAIKEVGSKLVLDVGCNTGTYSAIAAREGASVVAIDYDPTVIGHVWREAKKEQLDVLPLVVNLSRPSPALGWRNRECPSFIDRARGRFDMVMMLAVIHHLLVTERVPLEEIVGLAAELTHGHAIIEFVSPQDSMFKRLVRGREELHADLTNEVFETCVKKRFEIVRCLHSEGSARWLYLLKKL